MWALHGKRLLAAVVFVAAVLILTVQFTTPSPVVVSVGDGGANTVELGHYFTAADVAVIGVAASLLGASGTYLLLSDDADTSPRTAAHDRPGSPTRASARETDARDPERIAQRLPDTERAVYEAVLDADGELAQSAVVERTDLSKATVSRTLDSLETKDLVERKPRGMGNVVVLR